METFTSGSYGRSRRRMTSLSYEQGKDHFSYLLSSINTEADVYQLLQCLVRRCSLHQLSYLWTSLESVAHREVINKAPLPTCTQREVTPHLASPPQRVQTSVLTTSLPVTASTSRVQTPLRRHMTSLHSTMCKNLSSNSVKTLLHVDLPGQFSSEVLHFVTWFQGLSHDWQQKECLQLLVTNLDKDELCYLATLLMSRQFQDFVSVLSLKLVVQVMVYVPAKDILKNCTLVSHTWNRKCSSECVWRAKVKQRRMGLPLADQVLPWKQLYLSDLVLHKNWARGVCSTRDLSCNKVLCVELRDDYLVTGSADRSVRFWRVSTGDCLWQWSGHTKAVWSVCFYGKSFVISGSGDHSIKIWNTRTGVCDRTLRGHSGAVWTLHVTKGLLISGAHDKMVHACISITQSSSLYATSIT